MKIELIGSNLLPPLAQPVKELPAFGMGRRTSVMRYVLSLSFILEVHVWMHLRFCCLHIFVCYCSANTSGKNILSLHIRQWQVIVCLYLGHKYYAFLFCVPLCSYWHQRMICCCSCLCEVPPIFIFIFWSLSSFWFRFSSFQLILIWLLRLYSSLCSFFSCKQYL